jgi:hypothetical protein
LRATTRRPSMNQDALLDPICGNWPLERVHAALRVIA